MLNFGTTSSLLLSSLLTVSTIFVGLLAPSVRTQANEVSPEDSSQIELPAGADIPDLVEDEDLKPSNSNVLSLRAGQRLMDEAQAAVESGKYETAIKKYKEARQVFKLVAGFHKALSESFSGADGKVSDEHRDKAFDALQMRDQSTYRLALIHRSQNKTELAVPLLVQIIRSQSPNRELGKKAYQQLVEIGFSQTPYPRTAAEDSVR